ncbi:hypothetical protein [Streptomyces bottropensis]|uniref:hypothetical protein n=1 Tax=Streptomyces bottropensis TaxID=42235 RepID=UPI001ADF06EB|nr:hypothetical protein [Streptomyces bottropensis]
MAEDSAAALASRRFRETLQGRKHWSSEREARLDAAGLPGCRAAGLPGCRAAGLPGCRAAGLPGRGSSI